MMELLSFPLTLELHKRGIGVRHYGLVRSLLPHDCPARALLLAEIFNVREDRLIE